MSFNNFKTGLQDLFQMQSNCDVTFSCSDSTSATGKSTIMAHKLVLSLASEVFDTMFNGEAAKHENVKDEGKPINIDDIKMPTFKLFLSFIYTDLVEFETPESAAELYYAAHKYNVIDALEFIKTYMLKEASSENVIVFYEIACLYEDQVLKDTCLKIFSEHTMDILNSPNFLRADPKIIEDIYKLNSLYISSELTLIKALERYIDHNKPDKSDIAEKVRPALGHIRFLTLAAPQIAQTTLLNSEDSSAVIKCLSSGAAASEMPTFLSSNSKKRAFLRYKNEIELILKLSQVYSDKYCNKCITYDCHYSSHAYWNCQDIETYYAERNVIKKFIKSTSMSFCRIIMQMIWQLFLKYTNL